MSTSTALFRMGRIVGTRAALETLVTAGVSPNELLARHCSGDWGNLSAADVAANTRAVHDGSRILSAYVLPGAEERVWIITEADRSHTTVLLASEY